MSDISHPQCERCLEPVYACECLPLDMEEYEAPEVAWLASRPIRAGSKVTREKKHRYQKACREVERLNRLYAGKVMHFLLSV
jgi:hypothetical protein